MVLPSFFSQRSLGSDLKERGGEQIQTVPDTTGFSVRNHKHNIFFLRVFWTKKVCAFLWRARNNVRSEEKILSEIDVAPGYVSGPRFFLFVRLSFTTSSRVFFTFVQKRHVFLVWKRDEHISMFPSCDPWKKGENEAWNEEPEILLFLFFFLEPVTHFLISQRRFLMGRRKEKGLFWMTTNFSLCMTFQPLSRKPLML